MFLVFLTKHLDFLQHLEYFFGHKNPEKLRCIWEILWYDWFYEIIRKEDFTVLIKNISTWIPELNEPLEQLKLFLQNGKPGSWNGPRTFAEVQFIPLEQYLNFVVAITRGISRLIPEHFPFLVSESIPDAWSFPILVPGPFSLVGRTSNTP